MITTVSRMFRSLLLSTAFALVLTLGSAQAGTARVIKTLQHRLDSEGRHTLSPSLYERDAYQAHLRAHPEMVKAMRFDIQYSVKKVDKTALKVRLELRGEATFAKEPVVIENPIKVKGLFTHWAQILVNSEKLQKEVGGDITAWRVTIWEGDQMIAEQKSFLW